MYTAKIQSKTIEAGVLTVHVEFTDGTTSAVEWCKPQNEEGLKHWIKSRLETFNSAPVIAATYADGVVVDVTEPVVTPPILTQAEINRNQWLKDYAKWVKVKSTLIDTGIVAESQTQVAALKAKVVTGLKAEYLDYI